MPGSSVCGGALFQGVVCVGDYCVQGASVCQRLVFWVISVCGGLVGVGE